MRITNQKEFVKTAKQLHNNKYDYSLVDYQKSSIKVKIICPKHGVFEQTPNKHLSGQGCPVCGRNCKKLFLDEFIKRATDIHGDKYDYSKVVYNHSKQKVCIICPEHGEFWQTPHAHIINHQGCPKCGARLGGQKRTGKNNVAHLNSVKLQKQVTCLAKYGAKTWAESDTGRKVLHDIMISEDVSNKMKTTCQERYGADRWSMSDDGKKSLSSIMNSHEVRDTIRHGYLSTYGVDHYMKTEEGRQKARLNLLSRERQEKIRSSMLERYGVYTFFESDSYKKNLVEYRAKANATKRENGTFNVSKPEKTLILLLQDVFGKDDVIVQYKSELYPFHCDCYVKSLDLYIELNAHWTHGGHWFDEENPFDVDKLNTWIEKSKERGSRYYHQAIDVWTRRDLLKLQTAIDNHLNYLVFWKNDLSDVRDWLKSQYLL